MRQLKNVIFLYSGFLHGICYLVCIFLVFAKAKLSGLLGDPPALPVCFIEDGD